MKTVIQVILVQSLNTSAYCFNSRIQKLEKYNNNKGLKVIISNDSCLSCLAQGMRLSNRSTNFICMEF